ncbi:MAG: hypothetical protein OEM02_12715 [Desulfobulbaceae bacterium]|nr:hypothetical protein [Desulfobulbaceae bacterium]
MEKSEEPKIATRKSKNIASNKNPWPRRTLVNSFLGLYGISVLCFCLAVISASSFEQYGFLTLPYQAGRVYGDNAMAQIWVFRILSAVLFLAAVIFHLRYYRLVKNDQIPEDIPIPPGLVVCSECETIYFGTEVPKMMCQNCNGKIVTLEKVFGPNKNRPIHPNIAKIIEQTK